MFKNNPLDTVRFDDEKIVLLNFHIQRTFEAFTFLNTNVSYADLEKIYQLIEKDYAKKTTSSDKLRIIFTNPPSLDYQCEVQSLQKINVPVKVNTVEINAPLAPNCSFKWEDQSRWTELLKKKYENCDDILLINSKYDIIETSRFNVFCYDPVRDTTFTPPLSSGCLNGVYRRFALSEKSIALPGIGSRKLIERNIKLDELSYYDLFVANSVRGVLKASLV